MEAKISNTCKHLVIGVVAINIVTMAAGAGIMNATTGKWLPFILGVLLGGVITILLAIHMDHTINRSLDLNSEEATKYTRKMSIIRLGIMLVTLLFALVFSQVFNIIGVLLGILALKFSAYLQPLTSKYIFKNEQ